MAPSSTSSKPGRTQPLRRDVPAHPLTLAAAARQAIAHHPTLPLPGRGSTLDRWRALAAFAAEDVCLAKVLEAHYDALAVLAELDAPQQHGTALFAVWAAEPPDARVEFIVDDTGAGHLTGTKAWCSGASLVDMALVTAHRQGERILVCVDLDQPGIAVREGDWHAVGMARVRSGRVAFESVRATLVGAPGAYLQRPGFWHCGAGIAACWFGAASAIAETLRAHPRAARDPHAAAHLGAIDVALAASAALLRQTAARIDAEPGLPHVQDVMRARSALERVATDPIDRVGRALGPTPLCEDAAHAARCADLTTFVRQSHAERDWAAIGVAAGERTAGWSL